MFQSLVGSSWNFNSSTALVIPRIEPFQSLVGSSWNFNKISIRCTATLWRLFQSLVGSSWNFNSHHHAVNQEYGVSIPSREFVKFQRQAHPTVFIYGMFQSLVGSSWNFNYIWFAGRLCFHRVSIPSREFVKFQLRCVESHKLFITAFQSLVGSSWNFN